MQPQLSVSPKIKTTKQLEAWLLASGLVSSSHDAKRVVELAKFYFGDNRAIVH